MAHLYLSDGSPESLLGNLAADFLKAPASSLEHRGLREGVELHRKVDRFTDTHRLYSQSVDRLRATRRRAAPVLVDMFYDHFLARDFERYAPVPLADFLDTARERMLEAWHVLTPRLQASMERLMPLTWMVNYAVPDGISYAVDRLAHRVRTDIGLAGGGEELMRNYEGFDEDFKAFFAEMMAYVESLRGPRTW